MKIDGAHLLIEADVREALALGGQSAGGHPLGVLGLGLTPEPRRIRRREKLPLAPKFQISDLS